MPMTPEQKEAEYQRLLAKIKENKAQTAARGMFRAPGGLKPLGSFAEDDPAAHERDRNEDDLPSVDYLAYRIDYNDSSYIELADELELRPDAGEELWFWSSEKTAPPEVLCGECGVCVMRARGVLRM